MEPAESYRELMARLAEMPAALAAEQARVAAWHQRQLQIAQAAVDRASEAVRDADAAVAAAGATAEWAEVQSYQLWRAMELRTGPLGPPPDPAAHAEPDVDPLLLLRDVAGRLARSTVSRPRSRWRAPLLVAAGVLVAAGLLALGWLLLLPGR